MKVIGAGFGRTGTLSLKAAIEELGFGPCHHMSELFNAPERAPLWQAAAEGKSVDWDQALEGYQSTVDWPSAAFYAQLMEAYPESRVVLTLRDPERWYESVTNTIFPSSSRESGSEFGNSEDPMALMINAVIWDGTFGGKFLDKQRAISIYQRHIQDVKDRVPGDRLLVYDMKLGWEPLCRFLQVDVPADTPFPHVNTTEEWLQRRQERLDAAESA